MASRAHRWLAAIAVGSAAWLPGQAGDAKDPAGIEQRPPSGYPIPPAPVLDPAEALASLRVEPGLRVELVAAEPLVEDPVFATFDGDGRLWVVEMRGYMPDVDGRGEIEPVGAVATLHDDDGDGAMDRRVVFLDGLVLPRGLCVLRDGVLVIEPPVLWLARDLDGDGRADERQPVARGFGGIDSPEHAGNGLLWAMDNDIWMARHPAVFRWRNGVLHELASPAIGQWGLCQDDIGRLFSNDNSSHLHVDQLPRSLVARQPRLPDRGRLLYHRIAGDQSVWPIRVTPGVNRGYRDGVLRDGRLTTFTAACSPMVYRGDLLPQLRGDALVCEPAGNLVHRVRVGEDEGGWLGAEAATPGRSFLASTDERFRPVHLLEGPEGAPYVVDMYRGIIQHRLFVTTFLRRQIEQRGLAAPLGLGRIYRVVPDGGAVPVPRRRLSREPLEQVVAALTHPAGFWRDAGQRELVQRGGRHALPALRWLAREAPAPGRLHALWTLDGLGALEAGDVLRALEADDAAVRAAGVELADRMVQAGGGSRTVLRAGLFRAAAGERVARVAALLALALGASGDATDLEVAVHLVQRFADRHEVRLAAVAGVPGRELELLRAVAARSAAGSALLRCGELAVRALVAGRQPHAIGGLLRLLRPDAGAAAPSLRAAWLAAAFAATPKGKDGQARAGSLRAAGEDGALAELIADPDPAVREAAARLLPAFAPAPPQVGLAELAPPLRAQIERGRAVFAVCAGCHGADGAGSSEAPPLADSEWLLGPADRVVGIVLDGLEGPIEVGGVRWDRTMPSLAALADDDLAAVVTYARWRFAGELEPVAAADVAARRR